MPIVRKVIRLSHSLIVGLPVEIRKHLAIDRGDYVVWHIDKQSAVIIEKLTPAKHPGFFLPGTGFVSNGK